MFEIDASESLSRPPRWAALQRGYFDLLDDALSAFVADYFDEDGQPFWPPEGHVGLDGTDDVLEGFYNWPLVYAMGGDERFLKESYEKFDAAVERLSETETPFGHPMYVDEFDQCRDWFHLGEGNLFTYNMGLADPESDVVVDRAEKFAELYFGDADVNNYDAEKRLVRAPSTGSMGPEYSDLSAYGDQSTFGGYGSSYRWARHGLPWRDRGFENATELLDPETEEKLYEIYDERCSKGDIPLNLSITSLMTNAYLHTGDDRYREWVTEYLEAWRERTEENGGIIPDNVGLSGEIGEYIDGAWYGGFYGWSWGGWHYVGIGPTVAAENAVLLEGDREYLEFPRSQLDVLIEKGVEVSADEIHDTLYIPHKYGDPGDYHYNGSGLREDDGEIMWRDGWYEFQPHKDDPYVFHLWYMSLSEEDRERVDRLRDWGKKDWRQVDHRPSNKHGAGQEYSWLAYLDGEFPDYPERIVEANRAHVQDRLEIMREEEFDPAAVDEDYLRDRNPIFHRSLLQLTMGAPQPVYYGGLVMAQIRHFDPERGRPGLPPGVAALVEDVTAGGVEFTLVNTGGRDREVAVQAGAYGEHEFAALRYGGEEATPESNVVSASLPGGSRVEVSADVDRFVNDPTYALPWDRE